MSFHSLDLDNYYRKGHNAKCIYCNAFIFTHNEDDADNDKYSLNFDGNRYSDNNYKRNNNARRPKSNTYFQFCNLFLLFWVYVLQGIPLGIIANIPNMLKENGASFSQQAKFSLTNWSYILKIFWAPVVDSVYVQSFGRRKTWLVLMQYLIAALLMFISFRIEDWLSGQISDSDINHMTIAFFVLKMLDATQDIAADGWALSMHKNEQTAYTDVCDMVGLSIGYSIGHVLFLSLQSADFCNSFLRREPKDEGLVTFPDFLWFWSILYIVCTTIIALCTKEMNEFEQWSGRNGENQELGVAECYRRAWSIFYVPSVQLLALILLTARVMYSPYESLNQLKLIEMGFSSSQLALMHVPVFLVNIVLPIYTSLYVDKLRPMDTYLMFIPIRILLTLTGAAITYFTPSLMNANNELTFVNYAAVLFNTSLYKFTMYVMSCTTSTFFSTICDTKLGGTYLSLLNTITNTGIIWPNLVFIWLVDKIDMRKWNETTYVRWLDGYYIETAFATMYGIVWLIVMRKYILYLQEMPKSNWSVSLAKKRR